jgi:hypothetical protein
MVVHTYNPSIQETEAGGSQVCSQYGLHSQTLSQKSKIMNIRKTGGEVLKLYYSNMVGLFQMKTEHYQFRY